MTRNLSLPDIIRQGSPRHHPKPEVFAPLAEGAPVAADSTGVDRNMAERTAAQHTAGVAFDIDILWVLEFVETPLPDIVTQVYTCWAKSSL